MSKMKALKDVATVVGAVAGIVSGIEKTRATMVQWNCKRKEALAKRKEALGKRKANDGCMDVKDKQRTPS